MSTSKICQKCSKDFDVSAFYPHTSSKDGLHPWCIGCQRAYSRVRYGQKHAPATEPAATRRSTRGRPRKPDPAPR